MIKDSKKILILGVCGSGKSTLAKVLSNKLGLPLIHLDKEYWNPGWKATETSIWENKLQNLVKSDRWIMEGNYSSSFHIRIPEADTIINLDIPRIVAITRILMRTVKNYGKERFEMPQGCPERFDWEFLKYVWNFKKNHEHRLVEALDLYGQNKKVHWISGEKKTSEIISILGLED